MSDRTITLPADLVFSLEKLALQQGRSLDELVIALLRESGPLPSGTGNWALAVAENMEQADITWKDEPDASTTSREAFRRHLDQKRQSLQGAAIRHG